MISLTRMRIASAGCDDLHDQRAHQSAFAATRESAAPRAPCARQPLMDDVAPSGHLSTRRVSTSADGNLAGAVFQSVAHVLPLCMPDADDRANSDDLRFGVKGGAHRFATEATGVEREAVRDNGAAPLLLAPLVPFSKRWRPRAGRGLPSAAGGERQSPGRPPSRAAIEQYQQPRAWPPATVPLRGDCRRRASRRVS